MSELLLSHNAIPSKKSVGWGKQFHREPQHCNVGVRNKAAHHQPTKTDVSAIEMLQRVKI